MIIIEICYYVSNINHAPDYVYVVWAASLCTPIPCVSISKHKNSRFV